MVPSEFLLLPLLLLLAPTIGKVQAASAKLLGQTDASCNKGFEWMLNRNGDSPCALAASVLSATSGSPYTLPALPASNYAYPGPTDTNDSSTNHGLNRGLCSSPVYALLAACADCQGAKWVSFEQHTQSCNSSFTGDKLGAIASVPSKARSTVKNGTVLPPWVTHDWTRTSFSPTLAQQFAIANQSFPASVASDATHTGAPTTGSGAGITPVPATEGPDPTVSSKPASAGGVAGEQGGSGSNAGAIAGGAVGGVAILCGTGLAMYLLTLKTRDRRAPFSAGVGTVPGGGSAATRISSRDRTTSDAEWTSVRGQADLADLQRQASTWGQRQPPQGYRNLPSASTSQGFPQRQHQPQMSYSSTGHQASVSFSPPGHGPGMSFSSIGHQPNMSYSSVGHQPGVTFPATAAARGRSFSQSTQTTSTHQQHRPGLSLQTNGYAFPAPPTRTGTSTGAAAVITELTHAPSQTSESPQRSASSSIKGAFRALKGAVGVGGSPGALTVEPITPPPPARRPMQQVTAGPAGQGVTIVNMPLPVANPVPTTSPASHLRQIPGMTRPPRPLPEPQSASSRSQSFDTWRQ